MLAGLAASRPGAGAMLGRLLLRPGAGTLVASKHASRGLATPKTPGRLVLNHSTNLEGLVPVLRKLIEHDEIAKLVPARIHHTRAPSRRGLKIGITTEVPGGYKMIARAQSSAQEVFVTTGMDATALAQAVDDVVPQRKRTAEPPPPVDGAAASPSPPSPPVPGPLRMRRWYTRRQRPRPG